MYRFRNAYPRSQKINKLRTLANLLESHASHAIQFFVTVKNSTMKLSGLNIFLEYAKKREKTLN